MIGQDYAMDFVDDKQNSILLSGGSNNLSVNAQRLAQLINIGNMSKMGSTITSGTKGQSSIGASKIKKKQKNCLLNFFCLLHSSNFPVLS